MSNTPFCLPRSRLSQPAQSPCWHLLSQVALLVLLLMVVGGASDSAAQGSQLRPPSQMQSSGQWQQPPPGNVPLTAPIQLSRPQPTVGTPATSVPVQSNPSGSLAAKPQSAVVLNRFQTVTMDNKVLDLRTLPDATVLRGKSGRTITVARIKQLQARMDGASSAPMVIAQKGQSLKSLAAVPAGTLVTLPGGRITRSQDLAKIQTVYAKLSVKRVIKPIPIQQRNVAATAVVGQGISLAEAMKRPGTDVIQIGSHKYTAEQLRQMDTLLKASLQEPRGLLERVGTKATGNGRAVRQGGAK